ncbi:cytochrome P450 [Natronosporangium hydrolyticum]|uniref:Cytochrome P450 n=1 Tax=Natronosporangium hydrolyticum TaxID=2811111 RepID=A0A895YDC8_9ACTN|nr:cytochrome P450 [Natronosporangium hydrolyticum]QSB15787.1 cytochrome P450 [Natronosporangium hydrolyticum]
MSSPTGQTAAGPATPTGASAPAPAPARSASAPLYRLPARRTLPQLARDPMRALAALGRESDGAPVQLNLGLIRPLLISHPEHAQQLLLNPNFERDGMLWKPIRRLQGDGLSGVGEDWRNSRRLLQPLLAMRHLRGLLPTMAAAVDEALDALDARAADQRPVALVPEMMRITQRVMVRVFFGDRISPADSDRLGSAINDAFGSLGARLLLPFMPHWFPMPGDRAFRKAVAIADEVIYPLVRQSRQDPAGDDLVTRFVQATDEAGGHLDDQRVRDDLVSMFVAGTETTALTLSFFWLLFHRRAELATRVADEVAEVVAAGPPEPAHLDRLRYTKMALQETLRLYPVGWLLPRTTIADDELAGNPVKTGKTVILSPYLTHRLSEFWEEPTVFDPERFSPERSAGRHKFAYLPFGAGPHQCLGNHFSLLEGQLVVAAMLHRWRPTVAAPQDALEPRATASLRPRGEAELTLAPRR